MKKFKSKLYYLFLPLLVILLVMAIVVDCLMSTYSEIISAALEDNSQVSSEEYQKQASDNARATNIKIEQEGAVLLKNEDNTLPYKGDKVNVYGVLSASMIMNSSGSSSTNERSESFKNALKTDGVAVNDNIWNLLEKNTDGSTNTSDITENSIASSKQELAISEYTAAQSFADAKAYSDVAIVTIGRSAGEGSDPRRGYDNVAGQLELQEREIQLLEQLHNAGFKVITLVNSSLVIELGPVNQYSDAILWIGGVGINGVQGVADVLTGKTAPSGRLVDTWMYAQETSSSYYSSWAAQYKLGADGKAEMIAENAYKDGDTTLGYYTNYNEGIYVGYKWYETADKEGFWDSYTNEYTGETMGYDAVVAYPFGYGLSYTTFTEEIVANETAFDSSKNDITISVKVTNTGTVEAKDVVEIYVEKPYTDGGLETSVVELVGFAKTAALKAGGEETVKITIARDDLATFSDDDGCYVLVGGEYKFYVASGETGAHIWKTAGESRTFTQLFEEIKFDTTARSSDKTVATTKLATTTGDSGVASNDATAGFKELSRAGKFANAKDTVLASALSSISGNVTLDSANALYKQLKDNYGNYNAAHLNNLIDEGITATLNKEKTLSYLDLCYKDSDGNMYYTVDETTGEKTVTGSIDYNDSRWDELLSQMSLDELKELIGRGGYGTIKIDSIGKIKYSDYDGPTGFTNYMKSTLGIEQSTTSFCSEAVMASTWNVELIQEVGAAIGMEGNAWNMSGLYAPGLNMHRTPFGGRAGEYFSEDAFISGMMAAYEVRGLSSKGIMAYAKHFAFNDIEYQRTGKMNVVVGEQAAREIYLRAFEICVKNSPLTGMMTSYMLINGMWMGSNYNLINGITRDEWGFKGAYVTDAFVGDIMTADKSLCAGCDLLLSNGYGKTQAYAKQNVSNDITSTDTGIKALKTCAKRVLYAVGTQIINRDIEAQEANTTVLNTLFIVLNVIGYGGAAVCAGLFVLFLLKDLRKRKADAGTAEIIETETQNESTT